ncbi:hypothetical protein C8R45DRAFT_923247 [Mycena sanguinolenta]|nr:hypothetical protein C8R45DRAFT_923247 [Mycena sanguinolenta]
MSRAFSDICRSDELSRFLIKLTNFLTPKRSNEVTRVGTTLLRAIFDIGAGKNQKQMARSTHWEGKAASIDRNGCGKVEKMGGNCPDRAGSCLAVLYAGQISENDLDVVHRMNQHPPPLGLAAAAAARPLDRIRFSAMWRVDYGMLRTERPGLDEMVVVTERNESAHQMEDWTCLVAKAIQKRVRKMHQQPFELIHSGRKFSQILRLCVGFSE